MAAEKPQSVIDLQTQMRGKCRPKIWLAGLGLVAIGGMLWWFADCKQSGQRTRGVTRLMAATATNPAPAPALHRHIAGRALETVREGSLASNSPPVEGAESEPVEARVVQAMADWARLDFAGMSAAMDDMIKKNPAMAGILPELTKELSGEADSAVLAAECFRRWPQLWTQFNSPDELGMVGRYISQGLTSTSGYQAAANWVGQIQDPSVGFEVAKVVYAGWAGENFQQAWQSAMGQPDDLVRAAALSNIAAQQAERNLGQSADWIRQLPAGFGRDRSVAGYILGRMRFLQAADSVEQVGPMLWENHVDYGTLSRVLKTANIPEEERQRLLGLVNSSP